MQNTQNTPILFSMKVQSAYWYDFAAMVFRGYNFHYSQLLAQMSREETNHAQLILALLEGGTKKFEAPINAYQPPLNEDGDPQEAPLGFLTILIDLETHMGVFLQTIESACPLAQMVPPAFLATVSALHLKLLLEMKERIEKQMEYVRDDAVSWKCLHCGYVTEAAESAPELCPLCQSGQDLMKCTGNNIDF